LTSQDLGDLIWGLFNGGMKKICRVLIPLILASTGLSFTANATEPTLPQPTVFYMTEYTEILESTVTNLNKYKCKTGFDPSSQKTEIFARCTKSNMEIYLHGNADQALSYASFTAKKATAYPNLEFHSGWCAGKATGGDPDVMYSSMDWIKANYKGLSKGKTVSKVFAGLRVSITGGSGATRTISCGVKPS
jgi:hypothetical protein